VKKYGDNWYVKEYERRRSEEFNTLEVSPKSAT
jgi:hypothetical protein